MGKSPKAQQYERLPVLETAGPAGQQQQQKQGMSSQTRLLIALALNASYTCAELGAYYSFDSLAMLTDAVHNMSDVVAIIIAYFIEGLKTDTNRGRYTFGVRRAEVLGGVLNGTVLLSLCFYIMCDAVPRFIEPPVMVITPWFIAIAAAGVPINIASALLFVGSATQPQHAHAHGPDGNCPSEGGDDSSGGNMNLWAVFLHSMGDALTSVGVTIVAVIIYTHSREVDILAGGCADGVVVIGSLQELDQPASNGTGGRGTAAFSTMPISCGWTDFLDCGVSVFLSIVISLTVIPLLKQGVPVLLDCSPSDVDLSLVHEQLEEVDTVVSVEALHVWRPDRTTLVALVHATIDGARRDDATASVRAVLLEHAGVRHTSVQISERSPHINRNVPGSAFGSPVVNRSAPGAFAMAAAASCACDDCEEGPAAAGGRPGAPRWPWAPELASLYSSSKPISGR